MYEQLRQENLDLREYMGKMQKALNASDLEGTEKILIDNASLRNHNEEITKKVALKDEQIKLLNAIVNELCVDEGQRETVARIINEGEHIEPCLAVLEDDDIVLESEPKDESDTNGIKELVTMKNSGSTRESPQVQAKPKPAPRSITNNFKCDICKLARDSKEKLQRHMKNHTNEGDWTCDDCSYQSNEQNALLDHMLEKRHSSELLKHLLNQNMYERREKCGFCSQIFTSKRQLLNHKKSEHKTYQPCRNIIDCSWGVDCLYNHDPINENVFLCYQCGNEFDTRHKMMIHRKTVHEGKTCRDYLKGSCRFTPCWYPHPENTSQGFQNPSQERAPPQPQIQEQIQQRTLAVIMQQMQQQMSIMQQQQQVMLTKMNMNSQ